MKSWISSTSNDFAVLGFLSSLAGADAMGLLIIMGHDDFASVKFLILYLTVVPLILLTGLFLSLKAIPLVEQRGEEQQYAKFGLILNILFLCFYLLSLIPILPRF